MSNTHFTCRRMPNFTSRNKNIYSLRRRGADRREGLKGEKLEESKETGGDEAL